MFALEAFDPWNQGAQLSRRHWAECSGTVKTSPTTCQQADGAVLLEATTDEETTCLEMLNSRRCRLMVVSIETEGRCVPLPPPCSVTVGDFQAAKQALEGAPLATENLATL